MKIDVAKVRCEKGRCFTNFSDKRVINFGDNTITKISDRKVDSVSNQY
jgi:hypothetical protein